MLGRLILAGAFLPQLSYAATFAVYGDTRDNDAEHAKVVQAIARARPELALFLGDAVLDGSDAAAWTHFHQIESPLLSAVPVYAVQGNHDTLQGLDREVPLPGGKTRADGLVSFDALGAHFVGVDTEKPLEPGAPQFEHLVEDLRTASAKPEVPIIAFMHRAMYSSGHHGNDLGLQRDLAPLFAHAHVRAVFQSHDHDYERSGPIDGVTYFVEGGGGAPLRPFEGAPPEWSADRYLGYGYLLATIDRGTLTVTAFDSSGTTLDQVQIAATPPSPSTPPTPKASVPTSAEPAPDPPSTGAVDPRIWLAGCTVLGLAVVLGLVWRSRRKGAGAP